MLLYRRYSICLISSFSLHELFLILQAWFFGIKIFHPFPPFSSSSSSFSGDIGDAFSLPSSGGTT